ncbi:MAG: hypothetical protein AAB420_02500 [Patescibacteria group bacterium]
MDSRLSKYTLDELAERVEGGGDSSAQKAEPILIAKALVELQQSITTLQKQIPQTGSEIRSTIGRVSEELSETVRGLRTEMQAYSASNDKYATAMKWLTVGLVVVGVGQVIVTLIK